MSERIKIADHVDVWDFRHQRTLVANHRTTVPKPLVNQQRTSHQRRLSRFRIIDDPGKYT